VVEVYHKAQVLFYMQRTIQENPLARDYEL
jgi:hypothetical protein